METYLVHPDKLQEKALKAFLEALDVPYEIIMPNSFPSHVLSGINRGQDDIKNGKTFSLEEFKGRITPI